MDYIIGAMKGKYICRNCGTEYHISSTKNVMPIVFVFFLLNTVILLGIDSSLGSIIYLLLVLIAILLYVLNSYYSTFSR